MRYIKLEEILLHSRSESNHQGRSRERFELHLRIFHSTYIHS